MYKELLLALCLRKGRRKGVVICVHDLRYTVTPTGWCESDEWFSAGKEGRFAPSGRHSGCHIGGATGMYWAEARDAAKHATTHRVDSSSTENFLTQNVKSVRVEKPRQSS